MMQDRELVRAALLRVEFGFLVALQVAAIVATAVGLARALG